MNRSKSQNKKFEENFHVLTINFSPKLVIGLIRSELKAFVLNGNRNRGNFLAIVNCIFKKLFRDHGQTEEHRWVSDDD